MATPPYLLIYDGDCNLCSNLVAALAALDRRQRFCYAPMQDQATRDRYGISVADCELGMLAIDRARPERRWQGSNAAEFISEQLPLGAPIVATYRALPGLKPLGDRVYEQVRDHRHAWFGRRDQTLTPPYPEPADCSQDRCAPFG